MTRRGRNKDMGSLKLCSCYPENLTISKIKMKSVGCSKVFGPCMQSAVTISSYSRHLFFLQSCEFMRLTCEC